MGTLECDRPLQSRHCGPLPCWEPMLLFLETLALASGEPFLVPWCHDMNWMLLVTPSQNPHSLTFESAGVPSVHKLNFVLPNPKACPPYFCSAPWTGPGIGRLPWCQSTPLQRSSQFLEISCFSCYEADAGNVLSPEPALFPVLNTIQQGGILADLGTRLLILYLRREIRPT